MKINDLYNKNILFICNRFFNYYSYLIKEMQNMGANVDYYNELPSNSFLIKVSSRLGLKLFSSLSDRYYYDIIEKNKNKKYDYILIIKSETITESALIRLKNTFPSAKLILYLWDSVKNVKGVEKKFKYYDKILSFDSEDAAKYPGMKLRPLFFIDTFGTEVVMQDVEQYDHDLVFIGTAHGNRVSVVRSIIAQCTNRSYFVYFYLPFKLLFFYNKLINKYYKNVKIHDIHYLPLSKEKIVQIYKNSRCVVDIQHQSQSGLTMKTIEMLGMRKKIITTNQKCRDYDFYNENNILIIDPNSPVIDDAFFDKKYIDIDDKIYQSYTLNSFLKEIFF